MRQDSVPIDASEGLRRAHQEFARRLTAAGDEHWERQSFCDEWTVGDLVDHVIGGNAFTIEILRGATSDAAMAAAIRFVDHSSTRRRQAYTETAEAMLGMLEEPAEPGHIYHHVEGDMDRSRVVELRINDLTLHAWDLARSVGADESLDEGLVELVWENMSPFAGELATSGRFGTGATGELPAEAPVLERLLDLTGRR